jgi:predicted acylesterase/phospholipase RssA
MALSGTSAGAINAALIAAGKSPREMMAFWNGIADNPPVVASPQFFRDAVTTLVRLLANEVGQALRPGRRWNMFLQRLRNHVPPSLGSPVAFLFEYLLTTRFELVSHLLEGIEVPYVFDIKQLRARLLDTFGSEQVPTRGIGFAVNTVDAHTGRVIRFVNRQTPLTRPPDYHVVDAITVDMVLASASIPLLFQPVRVDNLLLWDGGLLVNTPLAPVVALGADEIITVLVTEPPDPQRTPFPHFGRAVERTVDSLLENAYNVDRKLLLERNRLAGLTSGEYRDVTLYDALRPTRDGRFNFDAGSYLYFEREMLAAMHSNGWRAASAWLRAGPRVDRLEDESAGAAA